MNSDEQIEKYRSTIDELDIRLLRLLNRRMLVCERIGLVKQAMGFPLRDRGRESSVIARLQRSNGGPLEKAAVSAIFRQIVRESRRVQTVSGARTGRIGATKTFGKLGRIAKPR